MPSKNVLSGKRVIISSIIVHTIPTHLVRLTNDVSNLFFIRAVKNAWKRKIFLVCIICFGIYTVVMNLYINSHRVHC